MSAGFVVSRVTNRAPKGPTIKYYVLREELDKRRIGGNRFAEALGVTPSVLKGTKGDFPMEKLDQCIDLLNNWDGPRVAQTSAKHQDVTRAMLLL
jgi:hypothetical protein